MEGVEGGDERKVRVLYFLSRDGKMEEPHLIRVVRRHRRRDGALRLRDVKRWLSELRGVGMPDAFAWACKRRYKRGYVWEDLADDDVITPVSGGEYVLMGSLLTHAAADAASTSTGHISSSSSSSAAFPYSAADGSTAVEFSPPLPDPKSPRLHVRPADNHNHDDTSPTPPPRVDDDDEEEEEEEEVGKASTGNASCRGAAAGPPWRKIVDETEPGGGGMEEKQGTHARSNSAGSEGGRGRRTARTSQVFRSLLRCGADAVQTHDSALQPFKPRRQGEEGGSEDNSRDCRGGGGVPPGERHQPREPTGEGEARRNQKEVRSRSRSRAGGAAGNRRKKTAATGEAYKPVAGPNCSQCGRPFRPERLHSHMKSCRALKGQRKNKGSGKLQQRTGSQKAMPSEEAASLFLLSH